LLSASAGPPGADRQARSRGRSTSGPRRFWRLTSMSPRWPRRGHQPAQQRGL